MNKEAAGELAWRIVKGVAKFVLITVGVLLVLLVFLGIFPLPLEFAGLLLFGWIPYLGRVIPQITFNPEIAFDAVAALGLALFGLHRILRACPLQGGDEPAKWRFGWTLKISVMGLLLFATSIAAVGMVHQIAWLCHEPNLIEMRGRAKQTWELANLKQVSLGLRLFADDHEGRFPKRLDELVPDYVPMYKDLFTRAIDGDPPQPVAYYPGYGTSDSHDLIILASPRPFEGARGRTRTIVHRDSSAEIISESSFHE